MAAASHRSSLLCIITYLREAYNHSRKIHNYNLIGQWQKKIAIAAGRSSLATNTFMFHGILSCQRPSLPLPLPACTISHGHLPFCFFIIGCTFVCYGSVMSYFIKPAVEGLATALTDSMIYLCRIGRTNRKTLGCLGHFTGSSLEFK